MCTITPLHRFEQMTHTRFRERVLSWLRVRDWCAFRLAQKSHQILLPVRSRESSPMALQSFLNTPSFLRDMRLSFFHGSYLLDHSFPYDMVLQDYGTIPRDKKNNINEALICTLLTMVLEKNINIPSSRKNLNLFPTLRVWLLNISRSLF